MVKRPAITLLVVGFLRLAFNLFMAGFMYVDEFVTPLGTTRKVSKAASDDQSKEAKENDRAAAVMAIFMLVSFSVACGMAIWGGFNMIKLRSYWLSMAASFAVMPGACFAAWQGYRSVSGR